MLSLFLFLFGSTRNGSSIECFAAMGSTVFRYYMESETSEIALNGNTRNWVSVCFVFRFEFGRSGGSEEILFWEMGFLQGWILIFDFPNAQENKFSTAALLILV